MKSLLKNLDTIQIIGFVISAAVSVVLFLTQEEKLSSIILGFILAILTQLFDMQKRNTDSEERLLKANALSQALYGDDWLLGDVQHIVQDYLSVKEVWFEPIKRRAESAICECRKTLHGLADGYMTVQFGGLDSLGPDDFAKAKKSIKAVAALDETYWRSPEANSYIQSNINAIQRKVRVVRVFTYPTTKLKGMIDILEKQQQAGIDVYIAPAEQLPKELNVDYLIVDDQILSRREQMQQERISIEKGEVDQMVKHFDTLLRYARKFEDVSDELKINA